MLNDRMKRFCRHVAAGKALAEAARLAGYAEAGAKVRGSKLMRLRYIRAEVDRLKAGKPAAYESRPQTPLEFLLDVMRDPSLDERRRVRAAAIALPYTCAKVGRGKKEEQADAAEKASNGRFAPPKPPGIQ